MTHGVRPEVTLTWDADRLLIGYGPFTITRNAFGAQTKVSDSSGQTTYTYDAQRPAAGKVTKAGAVEVYRCAYERDGLGRLTRKTETLGGTETVTTYAYDRDGRLTSVLRDGDVAETYTYDANDNRTSRTLGGQPSEAATYDAQDRLQGQGSVAYQFDADGYLAERGEYSFTYSERGELLKVMQSGTTVASYTYDPLGRRIGKTTEVGTWLYMYGDAKEMHRVTAVKDPAGVLSEYFYDDEGRIYAFQRGSAWYYVACDQVGSPRVISDALGQVVKTVDHDGYGNVQADSAPEFELPFGFAGGLADSGTGLVHFGYRDYDTASGRWTSRDPILYAGGQLNVYAYCANDPINFVDPSGLGVLCDFALWVGARFVEAAGSAWDKGWDFTHSAIDPKVNEEGYQREQGDKGWRAIKDINSWAGEKEVVGPGTSEMSEATGDRGIEAVDTARGNLGRRMGEIDRNM